MTIKFIAALLLMLTSSVGFFAQAANPETRALCTAFGDKELPLERDYRILTSKADIESGYAKVYSADRRLKGRAYFDHSVKSFVIPYGGGLVKIPASFWGGVANHITAAFKNQYIDGVIYPDFGHMHIYLPNKEWSEIKGSTSDPVQRMEKMFSSANLKGLYHTAEMVQLKQGDFAKGAFPQDPWKLWRYFSRNLLGSFNEDSHVEVVWAGATAMYNTVREVSGMTEVSTIYISSNHDACFSYVQKGEERFFDMTFEIIPYEKPGTREPSKARAPLPEFH